MKINMKMIKRISWLVLGVVLGAASLARANNAQIWQEGYSENTPGLLRMKNVLPEGNGVSDFWRVVRNPSFGSLTVYDIVGFAGDGTRTYNNYRPSYQGPVDIKNLILTPCSPPEHAGNILDTYWTPKGFSMNIIVDPNSAIFIHPSPLRREKPQGAGPAWNATSLEGMVICDDTKVTTAQQTALKTFIAQLSQKAQVISQMQMNIQCAGDMREARGYDAGKISNIEEVRTTLGLQKLPSVP